MVSSPRARLKLAYRDLEYVELEQGELAPELAHSELDDRKSSSSPRARLLESVSV